MSRAGLPFDGHHRWLLEWLDTHAKGLRNAKKTDEILAVMRASRPQWKDMGDSKFRMLKEETKAMGFLICSCNSWHMEDGTIVTGWYRPQTVEEVAPSTAQWTQKIEDMAAKRAAEIKLADELFGPQVKLPGMKTAEGWPG